MACAQDRSEGESQSEMPPGCPQGHGRTARPRILPWQNYVVICSALLVAPHSLRVSSHGSGGRAVSAGLRSRACESEPWRGGMGTRTVDHARLKHAPHQGLQAYAIACDRGHLLLRRTRLRLRGGSALNSPDQAALGGSSGRNPVPVHGPLRPGELGEPGPPTDGNAPAVGPPRPAAVADGGGGAQGSGGDAGASVEHAGPVLQLGENSTANEEAFVLMLNERDEGVRAKILQHVDLALRTHGVENSKILAVRCALLCPASLCLLVHADPLCRCACCRTGKILAPVCSPLPGRAARRLRPPS